MSHPSMRSFLLSTVRSRAARAPRLRLSMAGGQCVRELYYSAAGSPTEEVSDERLMKMAIGSALDEIALRLADGVQSSAHVPVKITLGGFTVRGVADLVLYDKNGPSLVSDLKVVGDETWKRIQAKPKQEHQAQVNLYAWGLEAPRWSVCYVHAGTGELKEHFGETDEFAAKRDFGAFEEAGYWAERGVPPPRPYEDTEGDDGQVIVARDAFPCRFCPHRTHCWEESNDGNHVRQA